MPIGLQLLGPAFGEEKILQAAYAYEQSTEWHTRSPELASIRRELFNARSRITRSLENLMRRSSEAIQEELVTVRNDRFVIPVRSDHQARIKGVAHGSSSSGATVFIEPLETIEANNELQKLREAEQRSAAARAGVPVPDGS